MQLLGTEIRAEGRTVMVEFVGEGGEKIAVSMASPGPDALQARSALIDRAKQMMVQATAFDGATNEYDQQSNGNFDETVATGRSDGVGPGYYLFEYRDAGGVRRLPAVELPSLQAAREEALRSAIDLLDEPGTSVGDDDWAVRVRDQGGELLLSIGFDEARDAKTAKAK
jgi:hypothetical protein